MKTQQTTQRSAAAFTLLELMIVTAVLCTVAGSAIMMVGQTEEIAHGSISMAEVSELREALIQFKRDTGFLPKHGPFALTTGSGSVPVPAEGEDWFNSPANLAQLFENPLAGTGHPLATWNPDTKRGWRGPYLTSSGEGLVDLGDGIAANGAGNPALGDLIQNVPAVADPFTAGPKGEMFVWQSAADSAPLTRLGRPYLVFDTHDEMQARIVGFGANRIYEGGNNDDIVFYLFR